MIRVIRPGPLTTVQDLGRPGYGMWGIVPGGAADRRSLRLANRLVGNAETAAGLEVTGGGLRATFTRATTIALTGAACGVTVGERAAGMNAPIAVPAGADVALGTATAGIRVYMAVRGGIDTPPVLGSRATDLVAGIGMGVLKKGDELPIGVETESDPCVDLAPVAGWPSTLRLHATLGPRADWFPPEAIELLTTAAFTVTPDSNRVGIRFSGPPLTRSKTDELASEPAIRGAIEIPPDGQPILFLSDHPTTCGYPVVAVTDPADTDLAAQARPGQRVYFRLRPPEQL